MGNQTSRFAGFREAILQAENELAQRQYNSDPDFRAAVQRLTAMTIDYYATETVAAKAVSSSEVGVTTGSTCRTSAVEPTTKKGVDDSWQMVSEAFAAAVLPALRNVWERSLGSLETYIPLEVQLEDSPALMPSAMGVDMPSGLASTPGLNWVNFKLPMFVALTLSESQGQIAYIKVQKSGRRATENKLLKLYVALVKEDGGIAGHVELDPHHPQLSFRVVGKATKIVIGA